jgi:hypothetical protein
VVLAQRVEREEELVAALSAENAMPIQSGLARVSGSPTMIDAAAEALALVWRDSPHDGVPPRVIEIAASL